MYTYIHIYMYIYIRIYICTHNTYLHTNTCFTFSTFSSGDYHF